MLIARLTALFAIPAVALGGCAQPQTADAAILGTWVASDTSSDVPSCEAHPPRTEYRRDGTSVTLNGAQRSVVSYDLVPQGNGFVFSRSLVSHNGEPNCAGTSAEWLEEQDFPTVYIEIEGDRMMTYVEGPGSRAFEMERIARAG